MRELELGELSLGDEEEQEDTLLDLGDNVFLMLGDDSDFDIDDEEQIRITIDEMVKGMGVGEVPSLELGYEFDEDAEEFGISIDLSDLTGTLEEEFKFGETTDGNLITELTEPDPNKYPYFSLYSSQLEQVDGVFRLKMGETIETLAVNYTECESNPVAIASAVERYKSLLAGAVKGLVDGLYNEAVYSGVSNYLRNVTGIQRTSSFGAVTVIDEEVKMYIREIFIDKEASKQVGYNVRKTATDTNGVTKAVDDDTIVSHITELLIRTGRLSSDIKSDTDSFSNIRDMILKHIDNVFYTKDLSAQAGSVRLRSWFENMSIISNYLVYTLVHWPLMVGSERIPLIKAEQDTLSSGSAGQSFQIVYRNNKGTSTAIDALKVFGGSMGDEFFRQTDNGIAVLRYPLVALTRYNYTDVDDSLEFVLHRIFSLGKYRGSNKESNDYHMLVQCDCGNNLIKIKPNLQAVIYYLSNSNSYQVQLTYIPVVCPYCGRVVLLERDVLDTIESELLSALRQNTGTNGKFLLGMQRNYGFRLSPPISLFFTEEHRAVELDNQEGIDETPVTNEQSSYATADLIRHIKEYEAVLNKFRVRKSNKGILDKSNFAYTVCKILMNDYDELKKQAVNSILINLSNDEIITVVDDKLKTALLSFWDKDVITEQEFNTNSQYLLEAINKELPEGREFATMDLLGEQGLTEDMKVPPVQWLQSRSLQERWDFLRLMCLRYFPSEKVDITGSEQEWEAKYKEVGELLRKMKSTDDLTRLMQTLNANMEQIACGATTTLPVDYRKYTRFLTNQDFLDWLDKASDLMLLTGLCDKITRYLLKTPRYLDAYVYYDYSLQELDRQLNKVIDLAYSEGGYDNLPSKYIYEMFYTLDKDFAKDVDTAEEIHRSAVKLKHCKKWEAEIESFITDVCQFEQLVPALEAVSVVYDSYVDGDAVKFHDACTNLTRLGVNQCSSMKATSAYSNIFSIVNRLSNIEDVNSCLSEAVNAYHTELITMRNKMNKIMGFEELVSSVTLELMVKYFGDGKFFEVFLLHSMGLTKDSVVQRKKIITDYVTVELNKEYEFQRFLLNMVYPVTSLTYVTEPDEEDETSVQNYNYLEEHTREVLNSNFADILAILPDEYKPFVVKYLGED